jgi:hypothetical protein
MQIQMRYLKILLKSRSSSRVAFNLASLFRHVSCDSTHDKAKPKRAEQRREENRADE